MSEIPAPICFPPNLNASPIVAYAQHLQQLGVGLQRQSQSLVDATRAARSQWLGQASEAFGNKQLQRAVILGRASQAIATAPDALVQYAETIRWAQSAHGDAMRTYYAAWNQLPQSEPVLRQCVSIQAQVIDTANTAAQRCAATLQGVKAQIASLSIGWLLPNSLDLFAPSPFLTGPTMSGTPSAVSPSPFDYTSVLKGGKYLYKAGLWTAEAFEIYLHRSEHDIAHMIKAHGRNGGESFMRNGKSMLAWKPGANLTATEGTLAQTTARLTALEARLATMRVVLKGANVAGAALSGGLQTYEDWDRNFTVGQRTARAATSTFFEGGGAWGGFLAGAAVGGAVGTGFGIVGAVPGAIIGGVFGLGGALLGGWLGTKAKDVVFENGPQEVFGGR